jgi:hypothetical protein
VPKLEDSLGLQVQARTTVRGRPGDFHDVSLAWSDKSSGYVLVIEDTPGRWFLNTRLGLDAYSQGRGPRDVVSIDAGADWDVVNMREILAQAVDLLQDLAHDFGGG